MNFWRNLVHEVSAGRFASAWRFKAGGGADLGSSTASSRAFRFVEHNSLKILGGSLLTLMYAGQQGMSDLSAMGAVLDSDDAMRAAMEEEGVSWSYCESIVAELKKKTKSQSASEHDRFVLQIYEEWLRMYNNEGRTLGSKDFGDAYLWCTSDD